MTMTPEQMQSTLELLVQVAEKNTNDISQLTENQKQIQFLIERLYQIQLAQSRDVSKVVDWLSNQGR